MPLQVSQQVLALHPSTKEPRTASLLTTFGNNYHVQYHNPDLGVYLQTDTSLVPISANDLYKTDNPDQEGTPRTRAQQAASVNDVRNQLLSKQLAGNQQVIQKMLSQVDEGARKQLWLQFDHTRYTDENKQAMALLFILIER